VKRLIVTGDDFGASAEINEGILRAHRDGILTCASLMVNEPAFDEAVGIARRRPALAVGLHLALSLSRATLPRGKIPDLVDAEGRLMGDSTRAGWKYFFSKRLQPQLEAEIRAQIEKFLATGLPIDHLNGHQHIHMHPKVFRMVCRLAAEYRIPGVRIVRDSLPRNLALDRKRLGYKLSHLAIFSALGTWCRGIARGRSWTRPDRVWGLYQDGRLDRDHLLGLLKNLPTGVTEIYCHPSAAPGSNPLRTPDRELAALTDPRVRERVRGLGIELCTYARAKPAADGEPRISPAR
jgi:hopanoid biosynthesis associated protein HpnK